MEDLNGGASAPAETTTVAAEAETVTPPAPVNSEPPKAEAKSEPKAEEKKTPTAREALKAAAEKVAEKAKAETSDIDKKTPPVQSKPADKTLPEPKPAKEAEIAAKPAETAPKAEAKPGTHHEAPARFKSDAAAMAEWEKAPEPVKAAVHRSIRELEAGIEKHRVSAEEFEKVKDFHELATRNKTTLRDAMTRYTNFERTILQNPIQGLQQVCDYAGISLRDVAAHIMGQKPDEVQGQNDATVRELRQELAALKHQIGGVTTSIQQQHVERTGAEVEKFAAEHPRFEELAEDIAFFIKSGRTKDLAEAYSLAERLNPAPAAPAQAAPQTRTAPDPQAQTLKGSKSVTGAPSAGSDPATKRASTSIKESLRRAMAQTG